MPRIWCMKYVFSHDVFADFAPINDNNDGVISEETIELTSIEDMKNKADIIIHCTSFEPFSMKCVAHSTVNEMPTKPCSKCQDVNDLFLLRRAQDTRV